MNERRRPHRRGRRPTRRDRPADSTGEPNPYRDSSADMADGSSGADFEGGLSPGDRETDAGVSDDQTGATNGGADDAPAPLGLGEPGSDTGGRSPNSERPTCLRS